MWFVIIFSICLAALIRFIIFRRRDGKRLPPGPTLLSSNLILLTNSLSELEPVLRKFKIKYGPLVTLSTFSRPSIFVGSQSIAHQLLIENGAFFSDRPKTLPVRNISSAAYGPNWRVLRRNLARVKSDSRARSWVLQLLFGRLQSQKEAAGITVIDHFTYAMFCLLALMCFGERLDEDQVNEIATVQRRLLLLVGSGRFNVPGMFPILGKILYRKRWNELLLILQNQEEVLMRHIISRVNSVGDWPMSSPYVDKLMKLQLPEEEANNGGKMVHKEIVTMCSEFLNAGTDTTATTLQWIMANLVMYPVIQSKLFDEIRSVVGPPPPPPPPGKDPVSAIDEDVLNKLPYLKAVVLEALRRHPPVHFVLPHWAGTEMMVQGFTIPQGATINFMVAEMGLDPTVWDEPMEFKPERFLENNGIFDITGREGIKMMPFGAGKRICPGADLALLHLQYFVANLIWYFHWSPPDGYHVDLSEKIEFTVVMKNPLQAKISPRTELFRLIE